MPGPVDRYFAVTPHPHDRTIAIRIFVAAAVILAVSAYFILTHQPARAVVTAVAAVALAVYGWSALTLYRSRYAQAEPKPTDDWMDDLLETHLVTVGARAMTMLGITPADLDLTAAEIRRAAPPGGPRWLANTADGPPTVFGPVFDTRKQRIGWGPNPVWRFRSYNVLVLCPTYHRMGVYQCALDIRSGRISKQQLREYFYSDVVTVSQVEKSEDLTMRGLGPDRQVTTILRGKTTLRQLEIVVASGDHSSITTGVSWQDGPSITLQESGLEYVVVAVRNLLRNKRPLPA
jgi:hypothetical protein